MKWELAIVGATVLIVAGVSRRLTGTPVTPAMVFVLAGVLVGPLVIDEVTAAPTGSGVQDAGRGDPCRRVVRRRLPDQASRPQARVCGSVASARDRPAADDRVGCGARGGDVRSAQCHRGDRVGDPLGADRCRPGRGGGDRAATPITHPPGTERRKRAQRRNLRPPAADRTRRRRRRGQGDAAATTRSRSSSRRSATESSEAWRQG